MATTKQTEIQAPKAAATGRARSPNFPAISLPEALKKVKVIYDADGRVITSTKSILSHLGYGANVSGSAGRVIAALRQYGLLEDAGEDKYRVSEGAFHILTLSEDSPIRKGAILASAQKPAIFRDMLNTFRERLPSDTTLRDTLITEKKFNPDSVSNFIRAFKGTIEFAKLTPGAYTPTDDKPPTVAVGDYIQWESQGVLQFEAPRKVTVVSPDGQFVQVEGSSTGIPMEQVTKVEPQQGSKDIPAFKPFPGMAREVFSLGDGEAVLQWPTSLTADGLEDLEAWLALVVKKLKRGRT